MDTKTKPKLVMAATEWSSNAEMVKDLVTLGYFKPKSKVLDPTYGKGTWWKEYRPANLTTHDLKHDGVDFRNLPEPDKHFDIVAFDPPYIAVGGRTTSTIKDFNGRYGLHSTPKTPEGLQTFINEGINELYRVLKPRGLLMVKCCDYVSSGKLFPGSHYTLEHALSHNFSLVDRLYYIRKPGPQSQTSQVHARQNLSTLLIVKRKGSNGGSNPVSTGPGKES
jgi:hypothetical protein